MEKNFHYIELFYKDYCIYDKSTAILHLYRNISEIVYNDNIRQYIFSTVAKRMSSEDLN